MVEEVAAAEAVVEEAAADEVVAEEVEEEAVDEGATEEVAEEVAEEATRRGRRRGYHRRACWAVAARSSSSERLPTVVAILHGCYDHASCAVVSRFDRCGRAVSNWDHGRECAEPPADYFGGQK
ncbi:hypothetical protein Pyn_18700 [Prunus yedoensis var. nudiflora]|uniref:Uncharacterized protein n=1 Tax=Prunus yedoensis var. nudiflora TaxID=2094558 RepID=A0A314XQE3_PRUYE|nr:hypothetical protein Pyn_18700 [Prunus yedoensis var. nudiflora]